MNEHGILFQGPMVCAILAGTKTQTRRVMKSQPYPNGYRFDGKDIVCHNDYLPPSAMLMDVKRGKEKFTVSDVEGDLLLHCPYGITGDRLWVRETWARTRVFPGTELVVYRAGDTRTDYGGPWKPGIHLFRRDSRITLEITGVRVERLQDISKADAMAEGIEPDVQPGDAAPLWRDYRTGGTTISAAHSYATLWESINGSDSWAANPWVWVVEFRRTAA